MEWRWCFLVSLLAWQAGAQAPDDFDETCRTGALTAPQHIFPDDWVLMLDNFDYQNLFEGATPVWQDRDVDGDNNDWMQNIGGLCTYQPRACTFDAATQPQRNWLFTQYVSYRDAVEVVFNISYNLRACFRNPACTNQYFTLHRYDTSILPADDPRITDINNYTPLFGGVQQSRLEAVDGRVNENRRLMRPANAAGFYLGIEDDGSCGTVDRIIVYYRVVRGRTEDLLTCPDVPLPPEGSTQTTLRVCECGENANRTSASLDRICNLDSVCNEDQVCACSPGFQLSGSSCTACPENTYKAGISNSSCLDCPANSESRGTGNDICDCIPPNIRNSARPQDPCTTPPSSPRLILAGDGAPEIRATSITVCWLPALEKGGLNDLSYSIYLYDTSLMDPVFERVGTVTGNFTNQEKIPFDVDISDAASSYGVMVVSVNGATGDPESFTDVQEVQDRFVVFFFSRDQCSVTVAVVVTLILTLLFTAVITTLVVMLIMWLYFKKNTPSPSRSASSAVKYHTDYEQKKSDVAPSKPQSHRPPPPSAGRKPPPRPPNKPAQA